MSEFKEKPMKRKGLKRPSYTWLIIASVVMISTLVMFYLWNASYALSPVDAAATATVRASLPTFDLFGTTDTACLGSTDPEVERIEQTASLKLPTSAKHLFVHTIAFQDCTVYIRFEMSADDLTTFLSSTYVSELKPKLGSSISFTEMDIDWLFDAETEYLYGEGHNETDMEYHTIIIDTRDPETYIVYVQTFLR
jgi:hypothetical protein